MSHGRKGRRASAPGAGAPRSSAEATIPFFPPISAQAAATPEELRAEARRQEEAALKALSNLRTVREELAQVGDELRRLRNDVIKSASTSGLAVVHPDDAFTLAEGKETIAAARERFASLTGEMLTLMEEVERLKKEKAARRPSVSKDEEKDTLITGLRAQLTSLKDEKEEEVSQLKAQLEEANRKGEIAEGRVLGAAHKAEMTANAARERIAALEAQLAAQDQAIRQMQVAIQQLQMALAQSEQARRMLGDTVIRQAVSTAVMPIPVSVAVVPQGAFAAQAMVAGVTGGAVIPSDATAPPSTPAPGTGEA